MNDKDILEGLAGGAKIYIVDLGGYDGYEYELRQPSQQLSQSDVVRLLDAGLIESRNACYILSDEGKKHYLRSTDELR